MKQCLFCPDDVPVHCRILTTIYENHHLQGRNRSDFVIPVCRYHHRLIHDGKISKKEVVYAANLHYEQELFYLPYPESKHIRVRDENSIKN